MLEDIVQQKIRRELSNLPMGDRHLRKVQPAAHHTAFCLKQPRQLCIRDCFSRARSEALRSQTCRHYRHR